MKHITMVMLALGLVLGTWTSASAATTGAGKNATTMHGKGGTNVHGKNAAPRRTGPRR